tara:strand:- start:3150 stop:3530 length:381 start_codon:yes stop_codon:yes gene_type:complete
VKAGLGYLEGILMISESVVMMLIALQFGFMAFILMKLDLKKGEAKQLQKEIETTLGNINIPEINLDGIKDELLDVVEDLMANMRVPTALDHGMGMFQQFMQMKQMKMAQDLGLTTDPQLEESVNED